MSPSTRTVSTHWWGGFDPGRSVVHRSGTEGGATEREFDPFVDEELLDYERVDVTLLYE